MSYWTDRLARDMRPPREKQPKRSERRVEGLRRNLADCRRHGNKVRAEVCACKPQLITTYRDGRMVRCEWRHWSIRGCQRGIVRVPVTEFGGYADDEEVDVA